jgi:pimeloyl-ACP methyl ester carboxylesterase
MKKEIVCYLLKGGFMLNKLIYFFSFFTCVLAGCKNGDPSLLVIKEQGSFTVGGTVIKNPGIYDNYKFDNFNPIPEGQTYHGDHAYVFYQIPEKAKELPLVFLHGFGQSAKTWETTADGREGFQTLFLRKKFGVYLIDQPRRGRAGKSTSEALIRPLADEQMWFDIFRIGQYPNYNEGVQFSRDPEVLENFFRQMTPNIGSYDHGVIVYALSELFDKIGEGILITHSQGGFTGWDLALKNKNIKAIVSYEPGNYLFPREDTPAPITGATGTLIPPSVPMEEFLKLTHIPIILYFGDYIPEDPVPELGGENWRTRLALGRQFVDTVNKYGGDATLVELPKIGILGNTHFMMSDLNNQEIADLLSQWLKEKGLDS